VIVSYFEWVQANQAYWWSVDEVETRLADRMRGAWEQVNAHASRLDLPLRTAATCPRRRARRTGASTSRPLPVRTPMNTQDAIAALDPKHGVFIDGRGLGTDSTFDVYDPATRRSLPRSPTVSAAEATDAVTAAHSAFRDWAATPARIRAEMLRRAFDLMIADTDRLAALICIENGKPQADARAEVAYAAEFLPLVQRRSGAHRRGIRRQPWRRHPHHRHAPTGRRLPRW